MALTKRYKKGEIYLKFLTQGNHSTFANYSYPRVIKKGYKTKLIRKKLEMCWNGWHFTSLECRKDWSNDVCYLVIPHGKFLYTPSYFSKNTINKGCAKQITFVGKLKYSDDMPLTKLKKNARRMLTNWYKRKKNNA